ncbi:SphA family protein [Oceanobacter mangrovi]|uniref:SphA family protein n=1 Tax=Oceanobacter mangrovi TaxID=2862510 RepID=UPI001C8D50FD|nr:transporter [Oceanobacter mangrovi]
MKSMTKLALCSLGLMAAQTTLATEGGGSSYPVGAENFTCCALPPPGTYAMVWGQHYSADKAVDNNGDTVTPDDFKVTANAIVPRVIWVTDKTWQGASVALHAILPLVDLDVHVTDGMEDRSSGIGDATIGLALGWHHSQALHSVFAIDVIAPTGSYDKDEIANIGRNHWAIQPVLGVSHIDPAGFNYDFKGMYTYNLRNSATDYKDGQELIVDYALGWGVGNGLTAGIGGYLYKQVTDDTSNGDTVKDARGQTLAIGPSVRYDSGEGWFATFKYQQETRVKNRSEGGALWLKTVFPF